MCPTRCAISYVLDFLVELFDEGCQYNIMIGLHRSALLAFHDSIKRAKIGNHPRVCDAMSGVFNQRPIQAKHIFIRNFEVVLEYLRNFSEENLLSDKSLTFRLVLLLALTSASRPSEMPNLNLKHLPG